MKPGLSLQFLILPLPNPTLDGHQQLSATSQDLRQHCSSCLELKDTKPKIKTRKKFQEKSTITTKACAQDEKGGGTEKMPANATPSLLASSIPSLACLLLPFKITSAGLPKGK